MRTEDQHKILLVEDDSDIAEELECILEALGHKCTRVETRDEAELAAVRGAFCLVLMDLRIKAKSTTLAPKIEAGRTLVRRLRAQFPERQPNSSFRTPILVLSAHTQGREEAVRLMQLGATDVLEKPLSSNSPSFDTRIADALKRSGRESHLACSLVEASTADELVINVMKRQVSYCGIDVPTVPARTSEGPRPRHLQKQAFAVLVALATRPGELVGETSLDEFLFEHNLLDDRVGSNLSAIRSRIVGAFADALEGTSHAAAARNLVEVSRGKIRISGGIGVVVAGFATRSQTSDRRQEVSL